jgi:hypothetical protein
MSTTPDSVNPAGAKPLDPDPTGQDPSAQDHGAKEKVLLQSVIFEVTREAEGRSLPEIRDMLESGFSRSGVTAPTNTWLDAVASAAFYGEPYIIDLPAALAADTAVTAPNPEVRERLASRRELRNEKLPAGTFPPASAWELDDSEVTGRTSEPGPDARAVMESTRTARQMLAVAAASAAVLVGIAVVRAVTARRRNTVRRNTRRPNTRAAEHTVLAPGTGRDK